MPLRGQVDWTGAVSVTEGNIVSDNTDVVTEIQADRDDIAGMSRFNNIQTVDIVSPLTAFGEVLTGSLEPKFQYAFPYDYVFTEIWDTNLTGSGSADVEDRLAGAHTGTTAGSTAEMFTRKVLYYRAGLGGRARFTTIFTSNNTSNTDGHAYAGLLSAEDGYAVGYRNGVFGFLHRIDGVDTFTAMSAWNLDVLDGTGDSGITLDPTKGNIWQIEYQYLGFGIVVLSVANPSTGRWTPVYHNAWPNVETGTNLSNPSMPFCMDVDNGTSTLDVHVHTASIAAFVEGHSNGLGLHWATDVTNVSVTSTAAPILSIRSRSTFHTRTNRAYVGLEYIGAGAEGTKPVVLRVYKGGTLTGASWTDNNTNESVIEIDTSATALSNGRHVATLSLGKDGSLARDFSDHSIGIAAGETITLVAGTASGTSTVNADITWREEI